jgi:hypothetical protein
MKNEKRWLMEENEPLCKNSVPREGVVIRKAHDTVLRADKLKCAAFLIGEALRMDKGEVDIEMSAGYGDDGSAEGDSQEETTQEA